MRKRRREKKKLLVVTVVTKVTNEQANILEDLIVINKKR